MDEKLHLSFMSNDILKNLISVRLFFAMNEIYISKMVKYHFL